MSAPPVLEFFKNKGVFLTGVTGFVGQVLFEKLLRSTDITKVYVLIRSKKGVSAQDRLKNICSGLYFETIRKIRPNFEDKVVCVEGDCALPDLGISAKDRQNIIENVNLVFHSAALVRFDQKLSVILNVNALGTKRVIDLSKQLHNFVAFVFVSTVFSNADRLYVEEKVYEPKENVEKLFEHMKREGFDETALPLYEKFHNTYIYSKHIAEYVVKKEIAGLPAGIMRPTLVIPTAHEPVAGWINNKYGPIGLTYATAKGILHVFPVNKKIHASIVPGDYLSNAIMASAWDISRTQNVDPVVYNFVSTEGKTLTVEEFASKGFAIGRKYPLAKCYWYQTITMVENMTLAKILFFIYHIIPGYFIDFIMYLTGNKFRILPIYGKMRKAMDYLPPFYYTPWVYEEDNLRTLWKKLDPRDKEWLHFDSSNLDWDKVIEDVIIGCRLYLGKEDLSTLPRGHVLQNRLRILHYAFLFCVYSGALAFVLMLLKFFF